MILRGERNVTLMTLVKLCGALEATPDELFDGLSWDPPPPIPMGELRALPHGEAPTAPGG